MYRILYPSIRESCRLPLVLLAGFLLLSVGSSLAATLEPETLEAWETYIRLTEERIASELDAERPLPAAPERGSDTGSALSSEPGEYQVWDVRFLIQDYFPSSEAARCREVISSGNIYLSKMETVQGDGRRIKVPKGLIHHWFGSVLVPEAGLVELIEWLENYSDHDQYFEEVEASSLLCRDGDLFDVFLRLRRKKVLTVYYNTLHRVEYRHHDSLRVSSRSRAVKIAQIEKPGTPEEREKPPGEDDGFLWRLNSYWRFEEVDSGVIVECESVSLSRGIPVLLKWIIAGYVNSVPRESMENTLGSIRDRNKADRSAPEKPAAGTPAPGIPIPETATPETHLP